jgi:chorismate synthase
MLRFLTAGESHGPALTAIVEGLPAGLTLRAESIDRDLRRRQMGYGRGGRTRWISSAGWWATGPSARRWPC